MCNFFIKLFLKLPPKKQKIDLTRWDRFIAESDTYINSILDQSNLEDVGAALAYVDEKTKQRFIESAKLLQIIGLENYIKKKQSISKYDSDKTKLILLNSFKAKGFTPLPGFQHY
jgi:hypothetical protein